MQTKQRMLIAGAGLAALSTGREASLGVIENRGQAMPEDARRAVMGPDARRDRKDRKRDAALELVRMSNETLVVAHLHPRWLRQAVDDMMDAGANVTHGIVNHLREQGPEAARATVEAFRGQ